MYLVQSNGVKTYFDKEQVYELKKTRNNFTRTSLLIFFKMCKQKYRIR